ncbi:MAG: low molecular weight protein arginine phosphatase [Verrucomicrobia bacterium]|nr:MAG: low molecular weight protein arginine phosphatase [Verrucomicrobiota bacterium]
MTDQSGPVIFICTANICRSPMAEQLFRHALNAEDEPYRAIRVASAGVSAADGQPASANSLRALQPVGLSLANHRSRHLTQTMLDDALAIFCMTETHLDLIHLQFNRVPERLHLMREFIPGTDEIEIPDPFGGNLRQYESCRDSMVEAIPSLVSYVRSLGSIS